MTQQPTKPLWLANGSTLIFPPMICLLLHEENSRFWCINTPSHRLKSRSHHWPHITIDSHRKPLCHTSSSHTKVKALTTEANLGYTISNQHIYTGYTYRRTVYIFIFLKNNYTLFYPPIFINLSIIESSIF